MTTLNNIFSGIFRKFPFRQDLGLKLMALYILFVVPVAIAALLIANNTQHQLEESIQAADLALARSIAQETDENMRNAMRAARELGSFDGVKEIDTEAMRSLFETIMSARPDVNLVYRLNQQGFMIYHFPEGPRTTVGDDFSFRDYFQRALITTNPLISKGRISPTTQQPVATAVMPLWNTMGEFLGVVATNIKLEALSQTLVKISQEYDPEEGFEVFIIDGSRQIIAHSDPEKLLGIVPDSQSFITDPLLLGRVDTVIGLDEQGVERLYSFVPVSGAGWGVIVSRPSAKAFETPRTFFQGILIVLLIFVVVGMSYWWGLSRMIIQPLGNLAAYSRIIGEDEQATDEQFEIFRELANRPDQVGNLTRSLMGMERDIEARLKELSTLLETSAAVVSTLDPQMVLNRILRQVERLLDVKMSAIVALDEQNGVFRVQASRGLSNTYVEQISIDPSEPQSVTITALRSGQPTQVSDTETSDAKQRNEGREEGYRSLLAIPLNTQYAPPSALIVLRPEPHIFTDQEIDLLSSFANHAAMAIENAALYARSDMQLQKQTRRLEALIQSLKDGLILEGPDGNVVYANRRISILTGLSAEKITGAKVDAVLDRLSEKSDDPQRTKEIIHMAMERQDEQGAEILLPHQGRNLWLRLHSFSVTDANDVPIGQGQLLYDITADRELDRMKSNLLSTVSHELRTPLASIKGYATTLLADDVEWDGAAQKEFLSIISNEADRLTILVNELLDLSRLEAGNLTVERRPCQLDKIVQNAAKRSNPQPGERLQVSIPQDLPPLHVDRRRIEVVIRNLIENAAKYSGDSSPIIVMASCENGEITVTIEDSGPGIPEEEGKRIFESFYRIDNGLSRKTSGAGLGLAISKGFIQAHGGNIWIEPRQIGACFAFTLPQFIDPDEIEE
ncbi:MAG: GAF domain-containing protein [Anaerolineales bacterium]|nr:GAF domain-containing protein [Anaerolineales bacterium]